MILRKSIPVLVMTVGVFAGLAAQAGEVAGASEFRQKVKPLLETYCYDCHADGANKGGVSFDEFKSDSAIVESHDLWWRALKNVRAGLMPPKKKPQPTAEEKQIIENWIKRTSFASDPQNPDPGKVTIRRLNRVEYQNTVRDLMGVDFETASVFPPDDTGHGFDNMSDVLTLPPMLLEKYVQAANRIVSEAVPSVPGVVPEQVIAGRQFCGTDEGESRESNSSRRRRGSLSLSYYQAAAVSNTFEAKMPGKYQLALALAVSERYVDGVFDYNKCKLVFRVDGKEYLQQNFSWEGNKSYYFNYDVDWEKGDHELSFELQPLTPDEKQTRTLAVQITSVTVRGPTGKQFLVKPKNYERFFPKPVPDGKKERRVYAREVLNDFASQAFRRPASKETLDRLVALAESVYSQPGKTFEAGVSQAMVAVLASPRFLFREEDALKTDGKSYPLVDEYALASRLSYFLWSSMPDKELFCLAEAGQLRQNLTAQVDRMLKDSRSDAFIRNFTGQWLRARDIESVPIEARFVLSREEKFDAEMTQNRRRFRELNDKSDEQLTPEEREELRQIRSTFRGRRQPRVELSGELRYAMRIETEKSFEHVLRENRSLLELLDSDYTFLNERLAKHYGITNVQGDEIRLVKLPPESPRGGILTQGTMLGVTSNPTRTSPVKRGVFILENVLGTPPPPPPPDIPPLEDATKGITNRAPSLRETLAKHREEPMCSSCHNRMDPLGLAFENFNAMGMWRDAEYGDPIDATGKLVTGEEFTSVRELKQILVKTHYKDFYRTVAEKLLTYALGRGLEYYDVESVDQIVAKIEKSGGLPSALMAGVVESAPFQKTRTLAQDDSKKPVKPTQQRADAGTQR